MSTTVLCGVHVRDATPGLAESEWTLADSGAPAHPSWTLAPDETVADRHRFEPRCVRADATAPRRPAELGRRRASPRPIAPGRFSNANRRAFTREVLADRKDVKKP